MPNQVTGCNQPVVPDLTIVASAGEFSIMLVEQPDDAYGQSGTSPTRIAQRKFLSDTVFPKVD
jgi:hypothetical protein